MARILIAGAGGLVGRSLARRLVERGHAVAALTVSARDLPAPIEPIRLSAWTPEAVSEAAGRAGRCDWAVNLAAYGVDPRETDPARARLGNVELPAALVVLAARAGAEFFLQVGSSAEYAELTETRPMREDDPVETLKTYGASKAAGTHAVLDVAGATGIPALVARLFGVYGPDEGPWRLLPALHKRLSTGERVPLSPGAQVRDFLHVEDAADGLIALAEAGRGHLSDRVVNLCSGVGASVRHFAELVADAMDRPRALLDFGAHPMRPGELPYLVGDTTRRRRAMKWEPARDLRSGLASAVASLSARGAT
ncbi:MAG: NAD(P)-dependent oxidoreductase [Alphaproteobacteria bacterium]|nr:NAD(P)-dependent oxidoreductase [Alphaproteobacteria bacterium]